MKTCYLSFENFIVVAMRKMGGWVSFHEKVFMKKEAWRSVGSSFT